MSLTELHFVSAFFICKVTLKDCFVLGHSTIVGLGLNSYVLVDYTFMWKQ